MKSPGEWGQAGDRSGCQGRTGFGGGGEPGELSILEISCCLKGNKLTLGFGNGRSLGTFTETCLDGVVEMEAWCSHHYQGSRENVGREDEEMTREDLSFKEFSGECS